ncbi:MAG: molybdopterin oxidoreductase [Calditrichaeota bacterium]|nr:MAG: molybdopterin oxidoreductase [Calditrichota bacterium]
MPYNKITRRKFLKSSAIASSLFLAFAGAGIPVLFSDEPKEQLSNFSANNYIYTSCGICVNKCGVKAHVEGGHIIRLEPNPHFPKSRGMVCARGNAGARLPYSADRLKFPLIRVGERGENKWRKASWEEALQMVGENLNKVVEKYENRSAVMFVSTEGFQEEFFKTFAEAFGSYNLLRHPTLCLSSNIQGFSAVFGNYPDADVKNAKYIIFTGSNRLEALITPDSIDLMKTGPKKLVVIDPRFTKTAAKANEWLPIKVGTDLAFALAMIHVLINENLYNKQFVEENTFGFEELKIHIQKYTPEWAEIETEISADKIRQITREFAENAPKSVYYPGRRSSFSKNDAELRRAMAMVNALVGAYNVEGGLVQTQKIKLNKIEFEPVWYDNNADDRLEAGKVKFLAESSGAWIPFRNAVLEEKPYPVKAMMVYKQNPVESVPNRKKTIQMMKSMDFVCVIDIEMSDTAYYADVILPESTYLERWDPAHSLSGIEPLVTFRQPVIQPLHDTKSCFEIMQGLTKTCNLETNPFDYTIQEYIQKQVEDYEGAYESLLNKGVYIPKNIPSPYGNRGFKTQTKKIEFYSDKYKRKGLNPMPVYETVTEIPEGKFKFTVGRHAFFTHSSTQNMDYLNTIMKENVLWLNTEKAKNLGIKNNDLVKVKSSVGEGILKAFVTQGIRTDTVFFVHGFGSKSKGLTKTHGIGASEAEILEDHWEPISGNALMHETLVEVTKVRS